MKNLLLTFTILGLLVSGCGKPESEKAENEGSRLIAIGETDAVSKAITRTSPENIVFTDEVIEWFNGTTNEIRFTNNIKQKDFIDAANSNSIKFYIDDQYLFSSMTYVSSLSSAVYDNLVFYYNITENKFFLMDGYPDGIIFSTAEHQQIRDANMARIAPEWNMFINFLKQADKYVEFSPTNPLPDPNGRDSLIDNSEIPILTEIRQITDSIIPKIPKAAFEDFESKYALWEMSWKSISMENYTGIRDYARGEEYADLLVFGNKYGKIAWPMIINKLVETKNYLAAMLLMDLTLPQYQALWDAAAKNSHSSLAFAPAMEYSLMLLRAEKENILELIR